MEKEGILSSEEQEALKLAAALENENENDDNDNNSSLNIDPDSREVSVSDLRKRVDAAEKRANDNLSAETRLFQENRSIREQWAAEKKILEDKINSITDNRTSLDNSSSTEDEPDITQDVDAWVSWNKKQTEKEIAKRVDERIDAKLSEKEKKVKEGSLQDAKISDYAKYISDFHPDKIEEVSRDGLSATLQAEISKWENIANREGISSIVKARKFVEAMNPDEKALASRVLNNLREKRATLIREGRQISANPELKGDKLRAASWSDIAERAGKALDGIEDLDM